MPGKKPWMSVPKPNILACVCVFYFREAQIADIFPSLKNMS